MVDLVGDLGGGVEVPGDERAICRVSAYAVGARDEVHAASQEQDVQGLLDPCFVHLHHLATHRESPTHPPGSARLDPHPRRETPLWDSSTWT